MSVSSEKSESICWLLAKMVEKALIEEASLTPKPGLVDRQNSGAHDDMNYALFIKSAHSLTPYFYEMAKAAWNRPLNQGLREAIAKIGRKAEAAMYQATNQVNTHKGAIWALGLLVSVAANQFSIQTQLDRKCFFSEVAKLAALPDTAYHEKEETHGLKVKKQFNVSGAYGEALAGYPHVQIALKEYRKHSSEVPENRYLHMLLAIIASLDDTCILYRSDQASLEKIQALAKNANQEGLPNQAFLQLVDFCEERHVSPGGSADLLAASMFIQSLKEDQIILEMLNKKTNGISS
ncbi:triphosphoribosyl-dephospho-CoA synthase MdcB [Enterococcus crotali]|uniref:triphosphoribosyl-dephospho-CoA synthase MdcB n=1 Tax=Enterococcus crotali TaxID=1453587 RepID=UPI000472BC7D|nr:triphosphoribosyl-dephospho-CoA synthase MdcB [Enterococcus crotali]